jgi:hypothetical protein
MDYKFPMWDQLRPFDPEPEHTIAPRCPCKSSTCPRHGFCDECRKFHRLYQDHNCTCMRREDPKPLGE